MSASAAMPVFHSPHPLRNRDYRLLWMGNTISWLGDQFYLVALPWIILQLSSSSVALGGIMMAAATPRAFFMLVGGAVSDRLSPRRIMMTTAGCRSILVALVGLLLLRGTAHLWHLYVLAFLFGLADAFYAPAAQVFLPSIVPNEQLPAANSLSQGTAQVIAMSAPAPAAWVLKALGAGAAFLLDAFSFLFVIGALAVLPDPAVPMKKKAGMWAAIREGIVYVRKDVALRSLIIVAAVVNFCIAGPLTIGLAWMAKRIFQSPIAFGILTSAMAAGSLAGLTLAGSIKAQKRGRLLLATSAFTGISTIALGQLHHLWSLAALLFALSASCSVLNIHLVSWLQQRVDRALLGRVMSVVMFGSMGLLPISLAVAGFAIRWSLAGMFAIAGSMVLMVTLFASRHQGVRSID